MADLADVEGGRLGDVLESFMEQYPVARDVPFGASHPASRALKEAARLVAKLLPASMQLAVVRHSVGRGNWASVPWIAILDPRVTTTTQRGVYPVLLFAEDMSRVAVTIAQGVTELKADLGTAGAVEELRRRAKDIAPQLTGLTRHGFELDNDFSLGPSGLGRDYVSSTIAHKQFSREALRRSDFADEVAALLAAYGALVEQGVIADEPGSTDVQARALVVYIGQSAELNFEAEGRNGWWGWKDQPGEASRIAVGDLIAFGRRFDGGSPRVDHARWQGHCVATIVVGRVTSPPYRTDERVMPDELAGTTSYPWKVRFEILGEDHNVSLSADGPLGGEAAEALRRSAINRGVGVAVPLEGAPMFERFASLRRSTPVVADQLAAATTAFAAAVGESGLHLETSTVAAFMSAASAKPFLILTGQSGSGKTQLAMRLGEWFGTDSRGRPRMLLVPVRSDWTGPEYLFGYQDALRSTPESEVWFVPDALEFMLRALQEPEAPFLLVLDEMNLAHVERYFADFLSGLESRQPVLPELMWRGDRWIAAGNSQRLPIPRNLFVVGTVNVDETTYMFSPKVLDRAFVFEFRTESRDLDRGRRRPGTITAGHSAHQRALVGVASDDDWHLNNPSSVADAVAAALVSVHELLSATGHEFGHRVMFESLRFSATLSAAGIEAADAQLDRILLTKVLPKLHGTRSRLEAVLDELLELTSGNIVGELRLPLSHAKLTSMMRVLRDAQFVSFTE